MDKLKAKFPEIAADDLWADEVRARLKQRAEEFPKEIENFKRYRDHGIMLEFGYGEQGLPRVARRRRPGAPQGRGSSTTKTVDAFGETRTVYHLQMAGPVGTDFKWITGDIDIVGDPQPRPHAAHRAGEAQADL